MTLPDILKALFILLILGGAGYYFLNYSGPDRPIAGQLVPCQEPLVYRIGSIDTRFGITKEEVETAMRQAVALWSDELSRPVAIHSEEGDVEVIFEYDERQQLVDGELRFRERIESEQTRLDQFHQEYEREKRAFEERSREYTQLANETMREIEELNRWVQQRSPSGGLTERDAARFEQRKQEIDQKQQQVERERQVLENMAERLNSSADRLNRMTAENNPVGG